ncbi:MAG: hypothetical protein MUC47_01900 [Candidatus Kapabacteria bacterium]|jgi:hypothetical protein|nr:hypothetical protein [Candidatus Kapabacteria bacterium]
MKEERIEPEITHEFMLDVRRDVDAESGAPLLVLTVTTVREFTSFGYVVGLQAAWDGPTLRLDIGGIGLPAVSLPRIGGAIGEVRISLPADGSYAIDVRRKSKQARIPFTIEKGALAPSGAIDGGFVRASVTA